MEEWKLLNSNLDVVDNAFEFLVNKSAKGEKGQYFTPRWVIDMCVKMLDPKEGESVIDTACGSAGFTLHAVFHVWHQILSTLGRTETNLLTSLDKPHACYEYVQKRVFGLDFDEKCVRVARCINLIAGDGQSNVLHLNSLDYARWSEVTAKPDWRDVYSRGWRRFRRLSKSDRQFKEFGFDVVLTNPPFAGNVEQAEILSRYEVAINRGSVRENDGA